MAASSTSRPRPVAPVPPRPGDLVSGRHRVLAHGSWILLVALIVAGCAAGPPDAGEWPQWRGPGGLGVSSQATGLPVTWSDDSPNILWRTELPGRGNSSPIVSADLVFLTTAIERGPGQVERAMVAVDFESGELAWVTPIYTGGVGKRHHQNTHAGPTPATDGQHVFAHFGDRLAAVDRQGQLLWTVPTDPDYLRYSHYGASSSVVLTDEAVVLVQDREKVNDNRGWMAAFSKAGGTELWRHTWDDSCCSYATPLPIRRGSRTELVLPLSGALVGFDPGTGERLWRVPLEMNQPVASAITDGDLLGIFAGAHGVRAGAVVRLTGRGTDTEIETLWETRKRIPETASPVLYQGRIYTLMERGILSCYEAATGRELFLARLPTARYQPSLVAGDGKIYAVGTWGTTIVLKAGPELEILAQNTLEEGGNASPAIAGNSLVLRTKTTLLRIVGEG